MKKLSLLIAICTFALVSCKSHKTTIWSAEQEAKDATTENKTVITKIKAGGNLTSYLRGIAGVRIQGSGASASIIIRGANSFQLSTEPLFVIDGRQFSGDYSSLYSSISINDIKSIEVLKDPSSLGMYGSSGANGVIKIRTKNH